MEKKYYAHSLEGRPPEEWQPLEEHLKNVAVLAYSFAESFGAGDFAWLAGLRHDMPYTIGILGDNWYVFSSKRLATEVGDMRYI